MAKKVVFMFSGQGSQFYNMGAQLYQNHPRFKLWMDYCDELLWDELDESILAILFQPDKKQQSFDRLLYTNPALMSVQYSLARVLMEMGIKPDLLLGYSLGEFTCAVVANALSIEDGLSLMVDSAKLIEQEASLSPMLAVIANESLLNEQPQWFENCHHTGTNFDINFVISGFEQDLTHCQNLLAQHGVSFQRLPVNYGFHTPLMTPLESNYKRIASSINYNDIQIPIVSSLTTQQIDIVNEAHFWQVLEQKISFQTTIKKLLSDGEEYVFIDVGPSGTLAMFVKYNLPSQSNSLHGNSVFLETMNPFGKDLDVFAKLESRLKQLL